MPFSLRERVRHPAGASVLQTAFRQVEITFDLMVCCGGYSFFLRVCAVVAFCMRLPSPAWEAMIHCTWLIPLSPASTPLFHQGCKLLNCTSHTLASPDCTCSAPAGPGENANPCHSAQVLSEHLWCIQVLYRESHWCTEAKWNFESCWKYVFASVEISFFFYLEPNKLIIISNRSGHGSTTFPLVKRSFFMIVIHTSLQGNWGHQNPLTCTLILCLYIIKTLYKSEPW